MKGSLSVAFRRSARQRRKPANRPFSIRLSNAERQLLEAEAGSQALGTYVKTRLLNGVVRRRTSVSSQHCKTLSELLGKLGRLRIASSLSDLAAAAGTSAIVMAPDLEQEIRSACRDLRDMRIMLMRALGLQPEVS